jgi:hypothetical protein
VPRRSLLHALFDLATAREIVRREQPTIGQIGFGALGEAVQRDAKRCIALDFLVTAAVAGKAAGLGCG